MSYQIACAQVNREITLRDWLSNQSIEVYLPVSRIQIRPRHKRRKVIIERAAFARYLFLKNNKMSFELAERMREYGFLHWLKFGEDIATLNDNEIELLRAREASGEFDKVSKNPDTIFKPGINVKVLTGPFAGFIGVVKRSPKRQGIAKVEIFGRVLDVPLAILAVCI